MRRTYPVGLSPSSRRKVTVKEACREAGVCENTVYKWIQRGKVEYVLTAGGHPRIFADTLFRTPSKCDTGADVPGGGAS